MSSMLEQAIVDAKMLKETAIKNAEESVVEKYSDEIKEAVEKLLEQDEDEAGAPFGDIPLAATDGEDLCGCPEDGEEVELDLSQIKDELARMETGEMPQELGAPESHEAMAQAMPEPEALEEDIEINEEDLNNIIGEMVADMKPNMSGWAGRPRAELQYEEDIDLANLEQNESEEEVQQTLKSALEEQLEQENTGLREHNFGLTNDLSKLTRDLSKLHEANKKLAEKFNKYKKVVFVLKEKLEESTVSNAKLLYTNKILNSVSLNERQKTKLVEAISDADSVNEAKTIYETLQSAVGTSFNKKRSKSLSEVVEKKSTTLLARRSKQESNAPSPAKSRMQKLAGIN